MFTKYHFKEHDSKMEEEAEMWKEWMTKGSDCSHNNLQRGLETFSLLD
jgi:hypothetical protein